MQPARTLLAEGRAAAPPLGRTRFCAAHGVRSEPEYKRRRRDAGRLTCVVILGTYNGGALTLGAELTRALAAAGAQAAVVFGGRLNEDAGGALPVDARPGLGALGIHCVDEIEQLGRVLAGRTT